MATSPTQRSLKKLRNEGWTADVTEKWIPRANIRRDLFGVIDVLCLRDTEILGVQATSYANVSSRVKKIGESEHISAIRKAGIQVQVWGWRKVKNRWQVRIVDIS